MRNQKHTDPGLRTTQSALQSISAISLSCFQSLPFLLCPLISLAGTTVYHAINIVLNLRKELGTGQILLPSGGLVLSLPIVLGGHDNLAGGARHLQFLLQLALLVGIVEAKVWLELQNEPLIGVLLLPRLSAGRLLGAAQTLVKNERCRKLALT
jgi:hypothetical protein